MSHELVEGQALAWIDVDPEAPSYLYQVGLCGVSTISVKMQPGQCGMVPWALVEFGEKSVPPHLVNLALAYCVGFLPGAGS